MTQPAMSTRAHFPVLDSVRGFAFLLVVFAHLALTRGRPAVGMSQFGVWIFFALSAFLLSRPLFAAPDRWRDPAELKAYAWRRVLRIFPPLAVAVTAYGWYFPEFTWPVCVLNFLCLGVYGTFWTVFVETRYYVLLPFVVAAVVALRTRPRLFAAILAAGLALHLWDCPFWRPWASWRASATGPASTWAGREHFFLQYLPIFVAGTLLAALHVALDHSPRSAAALRRWAPAGCLAAGLGFLLLAAAETGLLPGTAGVRWHLESLWLPLLPLTLLLVLFAASAEGRAAALLGHPLLRYFGDISYSGYLCHLIFVKAFHPLISNSVLYVGATLAATLAVATASHQLIERPFMKLAPRRAATVAVRPSPILAEAPLPSP